MKRILVLIALVALFTTRTEGQTFTFTCDTMSLTGAPGSILAFHPVVDNLTGAVQPFRIVRYTQTIPAEWQSSICVGIQCYPPDSDSVNFNLPYPSADFFFALDVSSDSFLTGTSIITLRVFNRNTPEDYQELTFTATTLTSGIGDEGRPGSFHLSANYPNPFNPVTTIRYTLPDMGNSRPASLVVYDLLGREVRTLVHEDQPAGTYAVTWNGRSNRGEQVSSGVYFYQLRYGPHRTARKMLMIK